MKIALKPIEEYQRRIMLRGFSWDSSLPLLFQSPPFKRFAHSSPAHPTEEGVIGFRIARSTR